MTDVSISCKDVADFENYISRTDIYDIFYGGRISTSKCLFNLAHHILIDGKEQKEITIPNSVTSIGENAFYNCPSLTSVTIPNSVTSIGDLAFYNCTGLTSVTIGNSVTSIGDYAFRYCSGLTSVTIGNSVTNIGNYAFSGCSGLTSISIPNSVTWIGVSAFSECFGLTKAEFASIESLCGIYFSDPVSNPLYYAQHLYIDGKELTSVIIPNTVFNIDYATFINCHSLTSVTIPNSVRSISALAFEECSSLTSVTIPNSVTNIGTGAFSGCSGLTSVIIGNSVTSIGSSTFYRCSGLTSVIIGNSVTSIGSYAFNGCSGLTEIHSLPTTPPSCGRDAFLNVSKFDCTVKVPEESIDAYNAADGWKQFWNIVALDGEGDDYTPGDINKDGKIDALDVNLLVKKITDCKLLGSKDPDYNPDYDLNKDGKIDVKDVTFLINKLVKK